MPEPTPDPRPRSPATRPDSTARPRTPGSPSPQQANSPTPPNNPNKPIRTDVPVHQQRAAAPTPPEGAAQDDDLVNVPAPTIDVFLPKKSTRHSSRRPAAQSYFLRQTLVPILLGLGMLLIGLSGAWFFTDEESPFRRLPPWMPIAIGGIGALLLVTGMINMLQLKHAMTSQKQT